MSTKTLFLFACLFICSMTVTYANHATDGKAKAALNAIKLAYVCPKSNSAPFVEAKEYLTDPATNKIIGQKLLLADGYLKYLGVKLNWENDDIPTGVLNTMNGDFPITLKWNNDRVTQIAIEFMSDFDYTVDYDEKGNITGFTGNRLINKKYRNAYIITFEGEQITRVTGFKNRVDKKNWIQAVTDYIYSNNKWAGHTITYNLWESNTPKNINSDYIREVTKVDENHFVFVEGNRATVENEYDSEGRIITNRTIAKSDVTTTTYKYAENKMLSEDRLVTDANGFVSRGIKVRFNLKDQPASVPDHAKREGWYKFDKNGECISEERDNKVREKINGVWGEWRMTNYKY